MNRRSFLKAMGALMGTAAIAPAELISAPSQIGPPIALAEIEAPSAEFIKGVFFKIDSLDLSPWLQSLAVDEGVEWIDVTSYEDFFRQPPIKGLTDVNVAVGLIGIPEHIQHRLYDAIIAGNGVVNVEMGLDGISRKCSARAQSYQYCVALGECTRANFNLRAVSGLKPL